MITAAHNPNAPNPNKPPSVAPEDVYRLMIFKHEFKEEFKLLSLVWRYGLEIDSYILSKLSMGGKRFLKLVSSLKESLVTDWLRNVFAALERSIRKLVTYLRLAKWFGTLVYYILIDRIAEQVNQALSLMAMVFRSVMALFS
ncbi:MAG: hypothetical protein ACP5HQ_06800 [Thermoprotei archaeon]